MRLVIGDTISISNKYCKDAQETSAHT